jgi:hypothetical protein
MAARGEQAWLGIGPGPEAEPREDAVKLRLEALLQKSLQLNYITESESNTFSRLRDIRNSYTHFRLPTRPSTSIMRSVARHIVPDDVFEQDALDAMEALVGFLHRSDSL